MYPRPFDLAETFSFRRYQFMYKRNDRCVKFEVVCPEYKCQDGSSVVIIPDYLLPGRKYPVFVYVYAIILYSSKHEMSQRAVAESIREKFGLPTFSHSTVGRIFKSFELSIKKASDVLSTCGNGTDDSAPIGEDTVNDAVPDNQPEQKHRFPSAHDTVGRRKSMMAFIKSIVVEVELDLIAEVSRTIVRYWFDKNKRLLI